MKFFVNKKRGNFIVSINFMKLIEYWFIFDINCYLVFIKGIYVYLLMIIIWMVVS